MKRSKCCLLGIPDDRGVFNVGGRLGAASGPAAFRKMLAKMTGENSVITHLRDLGDAKISAATLAKVHRQTADFIRKRHEIYETSVVVGGGHDHGFSQLLGVRDYLGKNSRLGCINIDAHFDLRKPAPEIGSGSPFYLAIEAGVLNPKRFVEFGIQTHCNAPALWDYAAAKKIPTQLYANLRDGQAIREFKKALKKVCALSDAVVISLDLDAAASAYAPGVSAPQAEGFTASEMIEMCEIAGREKKVISLGIFELNPLHDIDDRTARLAASCAFHFVDEVLARSSAKR
jgi:formimidoylglutamase